MSRIERAFGIDGLDLAIHVGVTVCLMVLGYQATTNGNGPTMVAALSLLVLGIRRKLGVRRAQTAILGEAEAERLAELEGRLAEVEQMHGRLVELEERLDFAERLLAQSREPAHLPGAEGRR